MDQTFLAYYETELTHLRQLAGEFAALHPTVARNLSLESMPCPDPYVERLLEGVAWLGARTRLKLDHESSRHARALLEALYPDLAAPAPAMTMAQLQPGPQVATMLKGHRVAKGTRLVAGLRGGLVTRAVYTTAQAVDLWPLRVASAEYLQDHGALSSAGASDAALGAAEAGLRLVIERTGEGAMAELALDRLDLHLGGGARGGQIFDAVFGWCRHVIGRPAAAGRGFTPLPPPAMVGVSDGEAMLPRVRPSFEGYRLLREYFLMPERFHYVRLDGLAPVVARAEGRAVEVILLLGRALPGLAGVKAEDFTPFVSPIVNLFERECNAVELDPRRTTHVVHADRTRPRDFEIYQLIHVEDAEREGAASRLSSVYAIDQRQGRGFVYATDRRPRRAADDEITAAQMRTSYRGDDVFVSVARLPEAAGAPPLRRLDIRALCTNRDLPVLDDMPGLTLDSGDPVGAVRLLGAVRRPRPGLTADLPKAGAGEEGMDDAAWRLIAQLSLSQVTMAEEGAAALQALVALHADRGDPAYARHGRAVAGVRARPVIERLPMAGPICFAHGTEMVLEIDDAVLSGSSRLLLAALLAQLFARHAAINSFVRVRTRLAQEQEEVEWPLQAGIRSLT